MSIFSRGEGESLALSPVTLNSGRTHPYGFGFEVDRLRGSLDRVPLEEEWTLVLLDPPSLGSYDVTLLRVAVDRGPLAVDGER